MSSSRQNPLFQVPRQRHGLEQRHVVVLRLADGGHVELCLVNGHGLHDSSGLGDNLHDVPRFLPVIIDVQTQDDAAGMLPDWRVLA